MLFITAALALTPKDALDYLGDTGTFEYGTVQITGASSFSFNALDKDGDFCSGTGTIEVGGHRTSKTHSWKCGILAKAPRCDADHLPGCSLWARALNRFGERVALRQISEQLCEAGNMKFCAEYVVRTHKDGWPEDPTAIAERVCADGGAAGCGVLADRSDGQTAMNYAVRACRLGATSRCADVGKAYSNWLGEKLAAK